MNNEDNNKNDLTALLIGWLFECRAKNRQVIKQVVESDG